MRPVLIVLIGVLCVVTLTIFHSVTPLAQAQDDDPGVTGPTPTPDSTRFPDLVLTLTAGRLEYPTPAAQPPNQVDKGAWYYWFVCLPCHGDRGQGLTDEWREAFGPEEMNCWQADCHGARHPDEGFELPRQIPPVLGAAALSRLQNGEELHRVIATSMPWWNPDYMTEEEEWNVTAYLLWKSGVLPAGVEVNAGNASIFRLRQPAPDKTDERPLTVAVLGLLGLVAAGLVWRGRQA